MGFNGPHCFGSTGAGAGGGSARKAGAGGGVWGIGAAGRGGTGRDRAPDCQGGNGAPLVGVGDGLLSNIPTVYPI